MVEDNRLTIIQYAIIEVMQVVDWELVWHGPPTIMYMSIAVNAMITNDGEHRVDTPCQEGLINSHVQLC